MDKLEALDAANVQVARDEVIYRASSLGSCTKALAAARQELEAWTGALPEKTQALFAKGNEAEEMIVGALSDEWKQLEVTLQLTGRIKVVGHIDGRDEQGRIVEVKRQNDSEFDKASIRDSMWWGKYQYQFSIYMLALGMELTCHRVRDDGKVKTEIFAVPPLTKSQILGRVLEVEQLAAQDLGSVACDKDDFPCPYFRLHPKEEVEEEEVVDTELADLALHYRRLEVELSDMGKLERRKRELRDAIWNKVGLKSKGKRRVRESGSGIRVDIRLSETGQRIIPPGTMKKVNVTLPDESKEGEVRTGEDIE